MKSITYGIGGVWALVAVAMILGFASCESKGTNGNDIVAESGLLVDSTGIRLPIAYVNIDTLLTNYDYATVASEKLMNKFQSSNNSVTQKQKQLENEYNAFNKKVQAGQFISQESGEKEYKRLQKMEADIQKMAQRLQNEFAVEEQKTNADIADSVRLCIEDYNKKAKYHVIFSNQGMSNILVAKKQYDITSEILTILNARYSAGKK